jgi:hypothetical protein
MQDTLESLRTQRNLLGEALGKLLVAYGVTRADVPLTGPELLLAAETAIEAAQGDHIHASSRSDAEWHRSRGIA